MYFSLLACFFFNEKNIPGRAIDKELFPEGNL